MLRYNQRSMNLQFFGDNSAAALIRSDHEQHCVEMWTTQRLPFEPRGVLLVARDSLRTELRKLTATPQLILEACYTSTSTGFVDTENVLLYNVGPSAFASATRYGLIFTREFADPPKAPNDEGAWRHCHRYTFIPSNTSRIDAPSAVQFRFELATLIPSLKPHHYWWAAKQGLNVVKSRYADITGAYEVSIHISGPKLLSNHAAIVKPLFDGVISALHFDPTIEPSAPVCHLLATALGASETTVAEALRNPVNAVFGRRRVVAPYREFIKWNPADELCMTGRLRPTRCESTNWSIDVAILAHQSNC
jgi:hypothetical protein